MTMLIHRSVNGLVNGHFLCAYGQLEKEKFLMNCSFFLESECDIIRKRIGRGDDDEQI